MIKMGAKTGGIILAALLCLAGSARAANGIGSYPISGRGPGPTQIASIAANGTTAGTCDDGGKTSASVTTTTAATVSVDISGTWSGTLVFYVKYGNGGGYVNTVSAYPVSGMTAGILSTTANGQWTLNVAGAVSACVAFNTSAQTGTAVVQLNATPAPSGSTITSSSASSAQVATAPTSTTLNGSTAVHVFTASTSICQTTVCNEDAAIVDTCGQTSAVTAAKGLPIVAGACYQTSYGYGGDVWCVSASGTPTVGVQSTSCR